MDSLFEEEQPNGRQKGMARHRGSTLVGTPKGIFHQLVYSCVVKWLPRTSSFGL